jgi:hypothetical protein
MLTQFSAPDAKPAQVAINLAALEASNYNIAPLKQALADIQAEKEAKKAAVGPGWWSGLSSPPVGPLPDTIDVYNPNAYKPPPPNPDSAYEKWKRETALQGY